MPDSVPQHPPLSICIPTRNDPLLLPTLENLIDTIGGRQNVEIIVIDDASSPPVEYPIAILKRIRPFRNQTRIGCGASRDIAAKLSVSDWLLLTDGHMVFPDDWLDRVMPHLAQAPESRLLCSTYVSLDAERPDMLHPRCIIGGADIFFFRPSRVTRGNIELMDVSPRAPSDLCIGSATAWPTETEYHVPAVMGAGYFVNRHWYDHIFGLAGIRNWGMDEFLLSYKTWLCGGTVAVMADVHLGHISQGREGGGLKAATPDADGHLGAHATEAILLRNKLAVLYMLLPAEVEAHILRHLPHTDALMEAILLIRDDWGALANLRTCIQARFVHDLFWFCATWGVRHPMEFHLAHISPPAHWRVAEPHRVPEHGFAPAT